MAFSLPQTEFYTLPPVQTLALSIYRCCDIRNSSDRQEFLSTFPARIQQTVEEFAQVEDTCDLRDRVVQALRGPEPFVNLHAIREIAEEVMGIGDFDSSDDHSLQLRRGDEGADAAGFDADCEDAGDGLGWNGESQREQPIDSDDEDFNRGSVLFSLSQHTPPLLRARSCPEFRELERGDLLNSSDETEMSYSSRERDGDGYQASDSDTSTASG